MFLKEVAEELYKRFGPELSRLAIVFPNKRPAVYFRQHLGNLINQPIWSPDLLTIYEFIQLSERKLPADRLLQSFLLYDAYREVMQEQDPGNTTTYERFFALGEILLNDYAELESNVISIADLYSNMANIAAIDQGLDYLTEEQQEYLQKFWKNFSAERLSAQKEKFLQLWRNLPAIFKRFEQLLDEKGVSTTGTLYRNLVSGKNSNQDFIDGYKQLVFVGFNALNRAELQLFSQWQKAGKAIFFFDADLHYIADPLQEAGLFLRRNLQLFGNELETKNQVNRADRPVHVIAAEGNAAQVRLLPQILSKIPGLAEHPERVALFLSDEQQLMPVLHALPDSIPYINITMGYGLVQSPVFSLMQAIIHVQQSLQKNSGKRIYYQPLLQLLQHPYLYEVKAAADLVTEINKRSLVSISAVQWSVIEEKRIRHILTPVENPVEIIGLIKKVLELQAESMGEGAIASLESQLLSAAYFQLNRLEDLLQQFAHTLSLPFVGDTILQVMRSLSVPLEGEPLKGLQVMGLLESRGLDFEHIILLNVNEGTLPKKSVAPTFIPDSIRRAYGLSVMEKQDAIFAYVFYRLLQKSHSVFCLYNSTVDDSGTGEQSRFLSQLEYETTIPFIKETVQINITPEAKPPIQISKDEKVMQTMRKFLASPLSPSAINNYLDCRLRFYFRHLLNIQEPETFQDEIDARMLGNILHKAMQELYVNLADARNGNNLVEAADFSLLEKNIDEAIDRAFGQELAGDATYTIQYSGSYKVIVAVIKIYIQAILKEDERYAPFRIHYLEQKVETIFPLQVNNKEWKIKLGGYIDRVDEKNGVYRIIDYKTGKDKKSYASIETLFNRLDKDRNKAALQTFIYTHILQQQLPGSPPVVAGIYDVRNMRKEGEAFDWQFTETGGSGGAVTHLRMPGLVQETMQHLKMVMEELFDERVLFDQTANVEKCQYCTYKVLCGR
ncbi:PD-(D/E)XK nuclease family protein [Flavihumibacter profundi]|uniref:PD-(D/E)XK nuclease family protein n=1 Tax=Flavihumibacter profundi TaxID=2716883 RepID=UPI001CC62C4F|nr:PD-(D/E)XK nuclease family protein [Flavihumibacter profundi]MBZ5859072.1 PD-(D/E)XK nuclease family protein [Flavihumibacter profundi]